MNDTVRYINQEYGDYLKKILVIWQLRIIIKSKRVIF